MGEAKMADEYLRKARGTIRGTIRGTLRRKASIEISLNIVVTGDAKAGKSQFIRKFLNYPPNAPLAASSGPTKAKVIKYERLEEMPDIAIYDAPGIGLGEMKMPPEYYCSELRFERFDVVIIMTSARKFTKHELALLTFIKSLPTQQQVFLVKTGSGNHCSHNGGYYYVNTKKLHLHDFSRLQHDIKTCLMEEKHHFIEKRLFILSELDVKAKAEAWRRDVLLHSVGGGVSGLSPVPGTDIASQMAIIGYQIPKLYRDFALSESRLLELCETYGLEAGAVQEIRKKFQYARVDADTAKNIVRDREKLMELIRNFATWGVAGFALSGSADVAKLVPVIGTAIGCAIGGVSGYLTTWSILRAIIDGCEQDGLVVIHEMRRLLAAQNASLAGFKRLRNVLNRSFRGQKTLN